MHAVSRSEDDVGDGIVEGSQGKCVRWRLRHEENSYSTIVAGYASGYSVRFDVQSTTGTDLLPTRKSRCTAIDLREERPELTGAKTSTRLASCGSGVYRLGSTPHRGHMLPNTLYNQEQLSSTCQNSGTTATRSCRGRGFVHAGLVGCKETVCSCLWSCVWQGVKFERQIGR